MGSKNEKDERDIILGLMDKLDLEYSDKINAERAKAKLERHLEAKGIPEGLTLSEEEVQLLGQMGYEVDGDDDDEKPAKKSKSKKDADEKPAKSKKDADEKPAKSKKSKKAPKKGMDRLEAACVALKKKKNHTMDGFVSESNKVYVDQGGKDNAREAKFSCDRVLRVLQHFEMLTISGDSIKMA